MSVSDVIFHIINRPRFIYAYIKTQLYYRLFFHAIGAHSLLLSPEFITNPSRISIGSNVIIHPNARILLVTKHLNNNYNPHLYIHDNVKIQQGCHIACAKHIRIGNGVTIGQYVTIFDIDHGYENITKPIHSQPITIDSIEIGNNCFIGKGAVIMKGTKLGSNCFVGANAVVKGVFPNYSVIGGIPAKILKQYNHKMKKFVSYKKQKHVS